MASEPFDQIVHRAKTELVGRTIQAAQAQALATAKREQFVQECQTLSGLALQESLLVADGLERRKIPTIPAVSLGVQLQTHRKYINGPWYRDIANPQGGHRTQRQIEHDDIWRRKKIANALTPYLFPVWDMNVSIAPDNDDESTHHYYLGQDGLVYTAWQGKSQPVGVGEGIDLSRPSERKNRTEYYTQRPR